MSINENEVYTIQKAAFIAELSYQSIYNYIRLKRLPASKLGGVWVVKGNDLIAFNEGRKARVEA